METLTMVPYGGQMSSLNTPPTFDPTPTRLHRPEPDAILRAITKRSFCTLATTSAAGRAHVAGVLYESTEDSLYINTLRTSRKALNILTNPNVGVVIPVRRAPVGPPSTIQFQGRAEILDLRDPVIAQLLESGGLKTITGHGELEMPDGCFIRIGIGGRLITHGLGMSLLALIRAPVTAGGTVQLKPAP